MTFQSLYRRYRPQSFGELVGQDHVRTALRNAVREGRTGHAYLFSGPRGTGKTTTARVLGKALNCREMEGGEPCNRCPSCQAITAGTSFDLIELDAASNRGVQEMRALLERVAYRSAGGARKVYLVDEVHMLTKEASAALLKTLEEPPSHVVFILATTDPHLVLPTIRSRTQHFEFTLLDVAELTAHLVEVAKSEGVEAEAEALELLAQRSGGSARDALCLLEQGIAYGDGRVLAEAVRAALVGTPHQLRSAVVESIAAGDPLGALDALSGAQRSGVDARQLADELLSHLRALLLVALGRPTASLEIPAAERLDLAAQSQRLGADLVLRCLDVLGSTAVEMRRATDPRLILEVALLRLVRRREIVSLESLVERLAGVEAGLAQLTQRLDGLAVGAVIRGATGTAVPGTAVPGTAVPGTAAAGGGTAQPPPGVALGGVRAARSKLETKQPEKGDPEAPRPRLPEEKDTAVGPSPAARPQEGPLDLDEVILAWPQALGQLRPRLRAMAKEAQPVAVEGDTVVFGLPERFQRIHRATVEAESDAVGSALEAQLGRRVRVRVVLRESVVPIGAAPDLRSDAPGTEGGDPANDVPADSAPAGSGVGALDSVGLMIEAFDATVEPDVPDD